jgi:hypothetical protein
MTKCNDIAIVCKNVAKIRGLFVLNSLNINRVGFYGQQNKKTGHKVCNIAQAGNKKAQAGNKSRPALYNCLVLII